MRIGCIIMAAGASKRFGSNKLLADVAGRPLIVHTIDNLPRKSLERIVVVSPYDEVAQIAREAGLEHVHPGGPARNDTVRAGIMKMARMDGCLFCVGDQPLCQKSSMQRMIDIFRKRPNSIVRLYSGVIPGNPILFPKSTFHELENLPHKKGGSSVLQRHGGLLVAVQTSHPWELDDVDTPETLSEIENLLCKSTQ